MLGTLLFGAGCSCILAATYGLLTDDSTVNKICDYHELTDLMGNGLSLSKNVRLSVTDSNRHVLMLAATYKGKTRRFILQNILKLNNGSLVVFDPAGEAARICQTNKDEYILAPNSKDSIGVNLLANCKNETEVKKLAENIMDSGKKTYGNSNGTGNQDEWVSYTLQLLKAYMLMNWHTKAYTFGTMIQNICLLPIFPEAIYEPVVDENGEYVTDKDGRRQIKFVGYKKSIVEEILKSNITSAMKEIASFSKVKEAPSMLASICFILNTYLQLYLDEDLNDNVLNKPNFDLTILRKKESILYIQIPDGDESHYSPFVGAFLRQMFDKLLDKRNGVRDGLQIYCLFDEWINCGYIQDFEQLLTTCRKYNISLCCATQNLPQIYSLYGKELGDTIIESFNTIVATNGLRETSKYLSDILGNRMEKSNNPQQKTLMSPDEIRRMKKNTMLIISDDKRPVIDEMMGVII